MKLPLIGAAYLVRSSVAATSADNRPPNGWAAFTGINQDAAPPLPSRVNLKLNGTISESVLILPSRVVKWRGCGGKSNYETLYAAAERQEKQMRGWVEGGGDVAPSVDAARHGLGRAARRYQPFHQPLNARPNLLTFMEITLSGCQNAVNSGKTFTNVSESRGPTKRADTQTSFRETAALKRSCGVDISGFWDVVVLINVRVVIMTERLKMFSLINTDEAAARFHTSEYGLKQI